MLPRLLIAFYLMLLGCSATCLRDSDCMGNSVCTQNRCLLVVSGDAGRVGTSSTPPPSGSDPDDDDDSSEPPPGSDAGSRDAGN